MGDFGIKISQPGFDIITTGDENLLLTSKYNAFKVAQTAVVDWSIVGPSGGVDKTITHNLGYKPGFMFFFEVDGVDGRIIADSYSSVSGVSTFSNMYDTYLEISINGSPGDSGSLRYFIFADIIE